MIDEQRFFAWLDGELDSAGAAEVAALVAADPALSRKAEQHRALRQRLASAFGPIAEQPVPQALADAARPRGAEVIDFAARRAARPAPSRTMQWMAMAATLAIGIVAGTAIDPASGPVARENGQLVASGDLEAALYTRLASAPAGEGARIGLTYRNGGGDLCRSFTDGQSSGLACHHGGDWRIEGLFRAGEGQQGDYRMASGPDPRLMEMVAATMQGEPLSAADEQKALKSLR